MEKVLVLSADSWSMTDEVTKQTNSGVSIWFVNPYREDTDTGTGYKPTKMSAAPELFEQLKNHKLPAFFELEYGVRSGAKNAAAIVLKGLKHVNTPNLFAAPVQKDK